MNQYPFKYKHPRGGAWIHESPIRLRCANHSILNVKYTSPASGIRIVKVIKHGQS